MTDDAQARDAFFDEIDPRLNVFALANGMDLAKSEGTRRLEWFSEGLERAVLIESNEGHRFHLRLLAWPTGRPEERVEAHAEEELDAAGVMGALEAATEETNRLRLESSP